MSQDKSNNNIDIQGLVLFKSQESGKVEESTSFEDVDQENAIKLLSELGPLGGHYRYSVLLANQSQAPITEVKVKIKYPNFLSLARNSPPNLNIKNITSTSEKEINQLNIDFVELSENSKKQVNLYFTPQFSNQKGKIATFVTFVNAKDFVRALNSNPIKIKVVSFNIEPKIMPSSEIQTFLQKEGIKKAVRSIGLGSQGEMNFDQIFSHILQIVKGHKFQLIVKDDTKRIAWLYGTELESKQDVLIIAQIVSNKIEFFGASLNHYILIPLLTDFINAFKKRVISTHIVDNDDSIYDLECQHCGMILPAFPKEGETIECLNCHKEQVIW